MKLAKNVLGGPLRACCMSPMTGFFRNGSCDTCEDDQGKHVVCVQITAEFLEYSKSVGNDLSTAHEEFHFPGLQPGDKWCLCALRWQQAFEAGKAPNVFLEASHEESLDYIKLEDLKTFAVESKSN